jgi:hypothetical protein
VEELLLGEEVVFLGTQEALASHLGVERKSIARWQKHKDCPGRAKEGYNVKDWKAFVERNNLGRKPHKGKAELDNEKIALGNEKLRILNARLRGELASQDEVIRVLGEVFQAFVIQLGQAKHTLAQEVVGISEGEAIKRIDKIHKELLGEIALGNWAQKKTFWSKVSAALSDLHRIHGLGRGARTTMSSTS